MLKMPNGLQDRKLLLLEDYADLSVSEVFDILRSPLGLAKLMVCLSFTNNSKGLFVIKDTLDSIKKIAAGLASAESKSTYMIANYATYLFAFQQFFHSSYRARQGNVLEAAVRRILTKARAVAYEKGENAKILKNDLGIETKAGHDVDILSSKAKDYLLVQIRSRDDTGGTTAKGSLVELLRDILREKIKISSHVLYVIYIWEPLQESQKHSLISKCLGQLEGLVNVKDLAKKLDAGLPVTVGKNIDLQIAYGPEQFSDILGSFTRNRRLKDIFSKILELLRDWDDLWITYAITSLELENLIIKGKSNFSILDQMLKSNKITFSEKDLKNYVESSKNYALKIIPQWKHDSLPVSAPSDQINYIRDLILMKMIHYRIGNECKSLLSMFSSKRNGEKI